MINYVLSALMWGIAALYWQGQQPVPAEMSSPMVGLIMGAAFWAGAIIGLGVMAVIRLTLRGNL